MSSLSSKCRCGVGREYRHALRMLLPMWRFDHPNTAALGVIGLLIIIAALIILLL